MPRRRPDEAQPSRAAPPRRLRPARRRIWPTVRNLLLAVVALLVLALGLAYFQVAGLAAQVVVRDPRPAAIPSLGGTNILIIGTDERANAPEEGVRGDTLVVAHMDTLGRWVNLLSIPRDTLVSLPDVGPTKINAAYGQGYGRAEELYGAGVSPQQGGMALAAQTVEQFLGLGARGQRIDYVVQVNFDGFARIIDALGGVTIDVPAPIVDDAYPTEDFGVQRVEFEPGVQRMDGQRALIYARTRHGSSDFERAARQQQVMRAIAAELRGRGPLGMALALPALKDSLAGTVTTTVPIARPDVLFGLAWLATGVTPDEIGQIRLSPETDPALLQDGQFNLIWSEAGLRGAVDALLTGPSEASEAARVQVLNGTGLAGLAGKVTGQLEDAGFAVIPAADAPATGVERTVVYDVNNKPRTSRRLAELLGAEVRQGAPEGVAVETDVVVVLGADAAE